MTIPDHIVEAELRAATTDLSGAMGGPTPVFQPTPRKWPVVAALLLLVGIGGLVYNLANDDTAQVATPTPPTSVVAPTSIPVENTAVPLPDPAPNANPVTGADTQVADPTWARPELLESYVDPVYGNTVRRMTAAPAGEFRRVQSSQRPIENVDGTLLLSWAGEIGGDYWEVVDRTTGQRIGDLAVDGELLSERASPYWHPTDPDVVWFTAEDPKRPHLRIDQINVRTGEVDVASDFTDALRALWSNATVVDSVGARSADGSRYVWRVFDGEDQTLGLATVDVDSGQVLGTTSVYGDADEFGLLVEASVSVSGAYVVVAYVDATLVYDADLTNERVVQRSNPQSAVALDADGRDVLVVQNFLSETNDAGWMVSVDLETLARTKIFDIFADGGNTNFHISGTGYGRPGWVVMSSYGCAEPQAWTCDKVLLVELQANPTLINVAHSYACGSSFWQGQVVVNEAMTRAYFSTDGGACDDSQRGRGTDLYQVTLPIFGG